MGLLAQVVQFTPYGFCTRFIFLWFADGARGACDTPMKSKVDSFHDYLRGEMENAGKGFETARERLFALMNDEDPGAAQALPAATEELAEAMKMYIGALRRIAHYSAHQKEDKAFAKHA